MKHWPSFEPFEEAGDSGKFLALWPSVMPEEPKKASSTISVEPEVPATKGTETPLPPIDPVSESAHPASTRAARFSPMLLLLSIAVHAAAIILTVRVLILPGVEAATDAISVEIVVDAPPAPTTDPSLAGEAAQRPEQVEQETKTKTPQTEPEKVAPPSPAKPRPEATEDRSMVAKTARSREEAGDHAVAVPAPTLTLPSNPPDIKAALPAAKVPPPALTLPPTPPTIEAPKVLATQQTAEAKVPAPALVLPKEAPKVETEQPAPTAAEIARAIPAPALKLPDAAPQVPDDGEPSVALPDQAPFPTSAPDRPNPPRRAEKPNKQKLKETPTPNRKVQEHQASQPAEDASKATRRPSSAGVGKAAGQGSVASRGGAGAGEKAAYAARLRSHVQRFERYPAEAERNGVTGSARVLITIDRGGRLLSSRLAGSSGSAILDDAARATARRAAPYPPPPDGIGGRTLTFAATVRFRR
jgi:protein TonB